MIYKYTADQPRSEALAGGGEHTFHAGTIASFTPHGEAMHNNPFERDDPRAGDHPTTAVYLATLTDGRKFHVLDRQLLTPCGGRHSGVAERLAPFMVPGPSVAPEPKEAVKLFNSDASPEDRLAALEDFVHALIEHGAGDTRVERAVRQFNRAKVKAAKAAK